MKNLNLDQMATTQGGNQNHIDGACLAIAIGCLMSVFAAPVAAGLSGICIATTIVGHIY